MVEAWLTVSVGGDLLQALQVYNCPVSRAVTSCQIALQCAILLALLQPVSPLSSCACRLTPCKQADKAAAMLMYIASVSGNVTVLSHVPPFAHPSVCLLCHSEQDCCFILRRMSSA